MLQFNSTTGETILDGHFEGFGYSGHGIGKNNPKMEAVPSVGPIPRGRYSIGPSHTHIKLGPLVFNLMPIGHDAHKRTLFRLHGDNKTHTASLGCIVQGLSVRQHIDKNKETELVVV